MPAILFLSSQVPIWLQQKATPTRYFVLVDQSGELAPLIATSMERSYQQKVLAALNEYARKYSMATTSGGGPGNQDSNSQGSQPRGLDDFLNRGAQEAYLERLRPRLREGAPAFQPPRRLFRRAPLPAGINTNAALAELAEALKPYLRGERQVQAEGQSVPLSAALLIPRDLSRLIVRPRSGAAVTNSQAPDAQIQYWSANASEFSLREEIERVANSEIRRREYLARGLDSAASREVEQTYLPVASLNPRKRKDRKRSVRLIP